MKLKKEYFECKCESDEHRLIFWIDDYNPHELDITASCYLSNYQNFFKRCWIAIKYIFQKTKYEGTFDSFLIKPEDYQRFIDMFEKVKNNNYQHISKKECEQIIEKQHV